MESYGGVGALVCFHSFLTSTLVRGEWSASDPGHFIPYEKAPVTHWIRGLVGPRNGMEKKLLTILGLELRSLGRPARNQSIHPLRYHGY
jgi:hypothetical protein